MNLRIKLGFWFDSFLRYGPRYILYLCWVSFFSRSLEPAAETTEAGVNTQMANYLLFLFRVLLRKRKCLQKTGFCYCVLVYFPLCHEFRLLLVCQFDWKVSYLSTCNSKAGSSWTNVVNEGFLPLNLEYFYRR